jgi:hypothetical protein
MTTMSTLFMPLMVSYSILGVAGSALICKYCQYTKIALLNNSQL